MGQTGPSTSDRGNKTSNARHTRLTIGYLAPNVHSGNLAQWYGVVAAAQQYDVNLFCFPGWSLHDPRGFQAQANIVYALADAENIDGMIVWASSIGNYVDADEIRAFREHYRSRPLVSIGRALVDTPSLLMESYEGMREAVVHLIEVHGCRRIAFIRGPENHVYAQERYRAYTETLEAHGIPHDPRLVTPPLDWGRATGGEMMRLLLHERKLRPQVDFEAVVSANDDLLLGGLEVLSAEKIRVPGDVAVVGFNHSPEGRASTPPLTSVAVPFYEVGFRSVETLLALMRGEQVPRQITVPSKLMVHRSCGCRPSMVVQATAEPQPPTGQSKPSEKPFRDILAARQAETLAGMMQAAAELGANLDTMQAKHLLGSFAADLEGASTDAFLNALDEILRQTAATDGDVSAWHGALSALRRHLLPYLDRQLLWRADGLCQQARVAVGEASQRLPAYRQLRAQRQAQTLAEIGASLITAFDGEELIHTLEEGLPRLGIPSAGLSLYESPQPYEYPQPVPEWSRLMLAYDERGRSVLGGEGRRFPSLRLLPADTLPRGRRYVMVVEPLYFRERQLGFVLLEAGPRDGAVYDILRGQISSALWSTRLSVERQQLVRQLERRTNQLQAAAEVSRVAGTILDQSELLQQAVNLIRDRFGFYYVGLFLVDESGRWAVLRAGTGQPGRQMVDQSHRLEVGGKSMIGQCVALGEARIALDVGREATRFANPLLPDTRSEMALALVSRGRILGAITIQSDVEAAFSEEDVAALQAMADQLAVAVENARLLEAARTRADRERTVRTIADRVRRGMSREAMMRIALEELKEFLGASKAVVRLGTEDQLLVEQSTLVLGETGTDS